MNVHLTSPSLGEESTLIWRAGLGLTGCGSVLVVVARSGYTHESRKVIELSRSASLVGRKSEGGLPELWNCLAHKRVGVESLALWLFASAAVLFQVDELVP